MAALRSVGTRICEEAAAPLRRAPRLREPNREPELGLLLAFGKACLAALRFSFLDMFQIHSRIRSRG